MLLTSSNRAFPFWATRTGTTPSSPLILSWNLTKVWWGCTPLLSPSDSFAATVKDSFSVSEDPRCTGEALLAEERDILH